MVYDLKIIKLKKTRSAKMEYKIKKIIFALGNIKYNESFCQSSHTWSNDETVFLNFVVEEE